ncbi:MAG: SURF1 family protein [Propionibacteriaceae bacterium]|nr:SURF1 family protein [Propionibacteriaceae bacterium]
MRGLWVRWTLLIVFVAILGTAFINLGEWQLHRLHDRRERNATTIANEQAPVRPFTAVFNRPLTEADQWQRVEARGTFDASHQFVVRYRSNGDASGYEVVTPLRTETATVLVDRGFIPLGPGVKIPAAAPAPPEQPVTVVGYARRNEHGRKGAVQPSNGQVRLINSDALAPTLPYPIVNGYLSALTVTPAQEGGLIPLGPPELSEGPHFWYAVQWFMFALIGVLGVVLFIRADLRERRGPTAPPTQTPDTPKMSSPPKTPSPPKASSPV